MCDVLFMFLAEADTQLKLKLFHCYFLRLQERRSDVARGTVDKEGEEEVGRQAGRKVYLRGCGESTGVNRSELGTRDFKCRPSI